MRPGEMRIARVCGANGAENHEIDVSVVETMNHRRDGGAGKGGGFLSAAQ